MRPLVWTLLLVLGGSLWISYYRANNPLGLVYAWKSGEGRRWEPLPHDPLLVLQPWVVGEQRWLLIVAKPEGKPLYSQIRFLRLRQVPATRAAEVVARDLSGKGYRLSPGHGGLDEIVYHPRDEGRGIRFEHEDDSNLSSDVLVEVEETLLTDAEVHAVSPRLRRVGAYDRTKQWSSGNAVHLKNFPQITAMP